MKKDFVSIIIVNYNGRNLLRMLLASIKKSTFKNYEIIIVDNNSDDGSQEFIKKNYKNAKLVANKKNLGYCGINSALEHCKGEYILFLNNDMQIHNNCIKNLVKAIKSNEDVVMAAPKLINFYDKSLKSAGTWVSRAFYNGHIKDNGEYNLNEIPYLGVGLIEKNFVESFGYLFDKDYFIYGEDIDLGLRIRLNGKKILFEPEAVMYHMHAVTMQRKSKYFATFLLERNSLMTFFKILSLKNIVFYLPYVFGIRLLVITRDVITLNINNALARIKAIFWIIFNIGVVRKKRMETQKYRKIDDSYILKIFSEKYLFSKKFII